MCGIAGIYHFNNSQIVSEQILVRMRDILVHRGPDGAGLYISNNLGLAHRRLSIIDLSDNAHQPFSSPDGRYTIVFNGEIFNYRELRPYLEMKGYRFRSESDTEVLLYLYMEHGAAALSKLNGMFAFAIFDEKEKTLFIARDRIGIKPLYYAVYNNTLYFASEPKAILTAGVPGDIYREGLNELILFRYIAGENTIFRHIKRLLPGRYMTFNASGRKNVTRWWNLPEIIKANRENVIKNPFEWFSETFHSSVKYRTISDVPVGLMLSGGLDSGSVACALANNGEKDLAAFTVSFDEKEYNEGHLAEMVAKKFGLRYFSLKISGKALVDKIKEAAWYYDEPLVHQNDAQMLSLAQFAKQYVTVLLSGEGADEFMGGYVRYKPLNSYFLLKHMRPLTNIIRHLDTGDIVNRFDKLHRYLGDNRLSSMVILNASDVYPADLKNIGFNVEMDSFEYRQQVFKEAFDIYPKEPARQAMYMDLFIHMASVLDRNDRMTMGAGIECRVPFMDYRLMEMLPALSSNLMLKGKKGKFLLYNSVAQNLPQEVLSFRKLGFSVPWNKYFSTDDNFKEFSNHLMQGKVSDLYQNLNTRKIVEGITQNDTFSKAIARQLFMINIWENTYFRELKYT